VPHVFQQEADRTGADGQASYADLAGEDESNDAANRLKKKERDEDANDSLDQGNKRRSWFPSSLGMSFILERGSTLEATVTWGDYDPPADGDGPKLWLRSPQKAEQPLDQSPETGPETGDVLGSFLAVMPREYHNNGYRRSFSDSFRPRREASKPLVIAWAAGEMPCSPTDLKSWVA